MLLHALFTAGHERDVAKAACMHAYAAVGYWKLCQLHSSCHFPCHQHVIFILKPDQDVHLILEGISAIANDKSVSVASLLNTTIYNYDTCVDQLMNIEHTSTSSKAQRCGNNTRILTGY